MVRRNQAAKVKVEYDVVLNDEALEELDQQIGALQKTVDRLKQDVDNLRKQKKPRPEPERGTIL